MASRKRIFLALGVTVLAALWMVFRPERAFIDRRVNEAAPVSPATIVLSGQFEPRAHEGHGVAQILALPSGERVLRFTDFGTLDGPDLQVYLLGSATAASRADLATGGYVSLGALKGNMGEQNYPIAAGTDLARYRTVAVWCRRFGVNFTAATLAAPPPGS